MDVRGTSGSEYVCRCPFHDDKGKPNLYVNAVNGLWLCHACGEKGNAKKLAQKLNVELLDSGVTVSSLRSRVETLTYGQERKVKVYSEAWLRQFDFDHPYWTDERGFSEKTVKEWQLGYWPAKDVVTIPMRATNGDILGVIERRLDGGKPKYKYPKGGMKGRYLFGGWKVKTKKVALVEGPLDAIACWQARVPALALMGARITRDQCKVLSKLDVRSVVLMMDNDQGGREAIEQVQTELDGLIVRVGEYRPYWTMKDPGSMSPIQIRKMFHAPNMR